LPQNTASRGKNYCLVRKKHQLRDIAKTQNSQILTFFLDERLPPCVMFPPYVMLNLFQHLTASPFFNASIPRRGGGMT